MFNPQHRIKEINRRIEKEIDRQLDEIFGRSDLLPATPDDIVEWTKAVRILKGKPFTFEGREHLLEIYRNTNRRIMIVKPRQTEVTEFAVNWFFFNLIKNPGTIGLYLADRQNHVSVFSKTRVRMMTISASPILKKMVHPKGNVSLVEFVNGSQLYMFSAFPDFESARSIPVDFAAVDEIQSTNVEAIPVLEEALAKSSFGRCLQIGTGSVTGDRWWQKWHSGDRREWDAAQKKWIPKNPNSKMCSYHITQEMITDRSPELEEIRKGYSPRRIANEVRGEWYGGMGTPLLRDDMMKLFDRNLDITSSDKVNHDMPVYAGFDWGGGSQSHTVAWIWQLVNDDVPRFKLLNVIRIDDTSTEVQADKAIELVEKYQVDKIVCDEGGGVRQVEKLSGKYHDKLYRCHYVPTSENPVEVIPAKRRINVDRTWVIECLIDLIKRPQITDDSKNVIPRIHLPYRDPSKIEWIIDNFTCIKAETIETRGGSFVHYVHGEETNDDALHAACYAYLAWVVDKKTAWTWVRF